MEVREYADRAGRSPFAEWFEMLDSIAAAKIVVAVTRIRQGNVSNVKSVGAGVFEFKIDFGPGYRGYLGRDGDQIVLLLAGGTKKRQQRDVGAAQARWADYKSRKKGKT